MGSFQASICGSFEQALEVSKDETTIVLCSQSLYRYKKLIPDYIIGFRDYNS